MPEYLFNCKKCEKRYIFKLGMNEKRPDTCEDEKCGGELLRDFKGEGVGIDTSCFRNDPSSHNYWKNGKSDSQVADILTDDAPAY